MQGRLIKNKKQVFFTRHGESDGNYIDSPLTDKGREQAKQLVGHFDCVVCSPLRRA